MQLLGDFARTSVDWRNNRRKIPLASLLPSPALQATTAAPCATCSLQRPPRAHRLPSAVWRPPPSAAHHCPPSAVRRPLPSAVHRPPSAAVRRHQASADCRRPPPSADRRRPPSTVRRRPPPSAVRRRANKMLWGTNKNQLNPLKSVGEIDTLIRKIYPSVLSSAHTAHDDLEPPWVAPLTVSGKRLNAGRRRENHYARNVPMQVQLVLWVATLGPTSGPTSWTIDCAFLR